MPTEFSNSSREMVSDQFLSHAFFTLLQAGKKKKKQHHVLHTTASLNTMPSPTLTTSMGKALSEPSYRPTGNAGEKETKANDSNNCSHVNEPNALTDADKV